jgi:glycine/D-amino acid oxidase-like deaminating enzyme
VPPTLPASVKHLVVGAGVHGLSTAWHLAKAGEEVLVVDKTGVAAGASGIACGVVRNNYFQPAMSELMAACVEIWESDPDALHYHGSGYIALGPPSQESDLAEVFERHQRIGYPSELVTGERAVREHMGSLYPGAVKSVRTSAGDVAVEQVVVAVGPWIGSVWDMLELPRTLDVRTPDGTVAEDQEMWTYWYLQEGEVAVDPATFTTAEGKPSPVLHVDSDHELRDDGGRLITSDPWGIYFKPDRESVQGGAEPIPKGHQFDVDPYPTGTVDPGFPDMWCAALSHCLGRFEGVRPKYRQVRSGGVGAFTVDNFPVFDYMRPNVYVAADSNHGYKMIAVGREIARVLGGEHSTLLHPFRYERFATGDLHPVSHSPYPWS